MEGKENTKEKAEEDKKQHVTEDKKEYTKEDTKGKAKEEAKVDKQKCRWQEKNNTKVIQEGVRERFLHTK